MTKPINDGGPVHPTLEEHGFNSGMPGMTLHDAFLLAVVQGELAGSAGHRRPETKELTQYAFEVADAMIAERNKRRGEG